MIAKTFVGIDSCWCDNSGNRRITKLLVGRYTRWVYYVNDGWITKNFVALDAIGVDQRSTNRKCWVAKDFISASSSRRYIKRYRLIAKLLRRYDSGWVKTKCQ